VAALSSYSLFTGEASSLAKAVVRRDRAALLLLAPHPRPPETDKKFDGGVDL